MEIYNNDRETKLILNSLRQSIKELSEEKYLQERKGISKAALDFIDMLESKKMGADNTYGETNFNPEEEKDLKYWEKKASFEYLLTPIAVLNYITELEKAAKNKPKLKHVNEQLRDKFASDALNGLMLRHSEPGYTDKDAVNEAYNIADMMMERREYSLKHS